MDNSVLSDSDEEEKGSWTMVYDEGFGVEFGNVKYFAFNRFYDDG